MRVYRLERQDGWGEYKGVFCTSGTLNYPEDSHYANYGCGVQKAHWNDDYRFACDSIDELIEYFGSDFAVQLKEGAIIVEYIIDKRNILRDDIGIELAFLSSKVKERIVCTKQSETSQSTGKTGLVEKALVMESWQPGQKVSSNWQYLPMKAENSLLNLKRMELYNELLEKNDTRGL